MSKSPSVTIPASLKAMLLATTALSREMFAPWDEAHPARPEPAGPVAVALLPKIRQFGCQSQHVLDFTRELCALLKVQHDLPETLPNGDDEDSGSNPESQPQCVFPGTVVRVLCEANAHDYAVGSLVVAVLVDGDRTYKARRTDGTVGNWLSFPASTNGGRRVTRIATDDEVIGFLLECEAHGVVPRLDRS